MIKTDIKPSPRNDPDSMDLSLLSRFELEVLRLFGRKINQAMDDSDNQLAAALKEAERIYNES